MIKNIITDIKDLRGEKVFIFGQETILNDSVDEDVIDIVEVLENLSSYEVDSYEVEKYNKETDEYETVSVDTLEEHIDFLHDNGCIEEVRCDNSYNWGANVSNHFKFIIYKNMLDDNYIVEFSVHRYGDVRVNYTESCLLKFDFFEEFYEVLRESNKWIELDDNNNAYIDILSDNIEIYNKEGEYVDTIYYIDDYFSEK